MNHDIDLDDTLALYGCRPVSPRIAHEEPESSLDTPPATRTHAQEPSLVVSAGATRAERLAERRARIRRRIRRTFAVAVTVGSFAGAPTASAYLASIGSGSGSASAGTLQPVTATAGVSSNLIPDGSTRNVDLSVTNPNGFAVKIVSVMGNGTITPDTGHSGCAPTGVTFTDQTGMSVSIPANASNSPVALPGAASMSAASANACQGATFTIPVTIKVQQP